MPWSEVSHRLRNYLHSREVDTLQELHPEQFAEKYNWRLVKKYPMTNIDEVIEFSRNLNPLKAEGFVICDSKFNRVKVCLFVGSFSIVGENTTICRSPSLEFEGHIRSQFWEYD